MTYLRNMPETPNLHIKAKIRYGKNRLKNREDRHFSAFALCSCLTSVESKRDQPNRAKERNSQFFADLHSFLLIFAVPRNCSISGTQILAENRRKPPDFAGNCRILFVPFRLSLLVPPCYTIPAGKDTCAFFCFRT